MNNVALVGAVAGLALVVLGWAARGAIHVTSEAGRTGRSPSAEPSSAESPPHTRPSPRWMHVLGNDRLAWAWVLVLAGALTALDRGRGGDLSVGVITGGTVVIALMSAGIGSLWTAWRRGERVPAAGRSVATVLVLAAAVVLGAWALSAWVAIGASSS